MPNWWKSASLSCPRPLSIIHKRSEARKSCTTLMGRSDSSKSRSPSLGRASKCFFPSKSHAFSSSEPQKRRVS